MGETKGKIAIRLLCVVLVLVGSCVNQQNCQFTLRTQDRNHPTRLWARVVIAHRFHLL